MTELPEIRRWMVSTLLVIYGVVLLQIIFFSRESGSRAEMDLRIFGTRGKTLQDHAWVLENLFCLFRLDFLLVYFSEIRESGISFSRVLCAVCVLKRCSYLRAEVSVSWMILL